MSIIEKAVEKADVRKQDELRKPPAVEQRATPLHMPEDLPADLPSELPEDLPTTSPAATVYHDNDEPGVDYSPAEEADQSPESSAVPLRTLEIAFDELSDKGMISPAMPSSIIAEEYRGIKRPLLKNIAGKTGTHIENANLVMVTSALQGDGKTFTSVNLALSIAMEQDKTVLFVDADVVKASAGRMLGVPDGTPGLIDILERKGVRPEDVILQTNMPKLRVLPAGSLNEQATELLAGESMHDLMLEMSARYPDRVIVFDSPPLLRTTEAGVLASFMGQIVFVASADVTPQHAVTEALEHIGPEKAMGVVLNRASRRRASLFGFGYGYGYGYGYGKESDSNSDSGGT